MCFIMSGENVAFIFFELPPLLSIGDNLDSGVKMQVVDFETFLHRDALLEKTAMCELFKFINSSVEQERVCCFDNFLKNIL